MRYRQDAFILAVLTLVTAGLYAQSLRFSFLDYDDPDYVSENPRVLTGLTADNMQWAFTTGHAANWHPLTWISHQLDSEIYGKGPAGPHATNVLLHILNTALLYLFVRRFSQNVWICGLLAALFAWHPLRAESVAWISERKDVLSGLFWLCAMHAYVVYARQKSGGAYAMTLVFLALGLLSKPMVVTLPCVLLLLDYWPLQRIQRSRTFLRDNVKLLVEKLPMFAMVIASSVITFLVQQAGLAVQSTSHLPLTIRVENSLISTLMYLRDFFAPIWLSAFHPHPGSVPPGTIDAWKWIASAAVILIITAFAFLQARRRPWLLVGWLWFCGTLVPVIGIVQVGSQARADRYTYLPMIGIACIVTGLAAEIAGKSKPARQSIAVLCILALAGLVWKSYSQIGTWRDSEQLALRALQVDNRNYIAHDTLASVYFQRGDNAAAEQHYLLAIENATTEPLAEINLGSLYAKQGKNDQAQTYFKRGIRGSPKYDGGYISYAKHLLKIGRANDAIFVLREGDKRCPASAELKHVLAGALAQQGGLNEAIDLWKRAIELNPFDAEMHQMYGSALVMSGRAVEGVREMRAAIALSPNDPEKLNALAWILATSTDPLVRKPREALELSRKANELSGGANPVFMETFAAAQAGLGDPTEARRTLEIALQRAEESKNTNLKNRLRKRIEALTPTINPAK